MTDIELAVLKVLKGRYGKVHAITRERLEFEVNLWLDQVAPVKDRAIREAIETLRQSHATGALIVSDPGYEGYWLAQDIKEVKEFVNRKRTTAVKMFQAARSQINLARDQFEVLDEEPQIRMFA